METPDQQQQRNEALQEALHRGSAFEAMTNSEGWKFVVAYYQELVQQLATDMITNETADIASFDSRRQQIIGIRKMMGEMESAMDTLRSQQKPENEQRQDDERA